MYSSSRKQRREVLLYQTAEQGKYEISDKLYKTEIRSLIRNGFNVTPFRESKETVACKISWKVPFPSGTPAIISAYLNGEIETFCAKGLNFAQELYVISRKHNVL